MPSFKLISFALCPFVQRSVITLNEKKLDYDIEYIELAEKPEWFLELSPLGKVPVLVVDGEHVLFESAVINEYIDEITPGRLLPEEPLERARGRAWIELASVLLADGFRLQVAEDEEAAKVERDKVRDKLERLERVLPEEGPYFYGAELSLVDTAFAPGLQRFVWCEELDSGLGLYEGLPKVARWRDALLARDAIKRSTVPDIREQYRAYIIDRGAWIARGQSA